MIRYPTFRVPSAPTRNDFLVVCDKCQVAQWTMKIQGNVNYCTCGSRQREATPTEYKEAKAALGE